MPRHLRYQSTPWATHHVVSRCLRGFSFLKPTPQVRAICAGTLGRSLTTHKETIKLHHYSFLSNHFHLLLSAEDTRDLASFMCHLKGNLARELCLHHGWSDKLWEGRYKSEEVLDEGALREVFKYITKNSVKEGLVSHPSEWVGLHGYHQIVEGRKVLGPWVNRTKLSASSKRKSPLTELDVTTQYDITLTPLEGFSEDNLKALCEEGVREAQEALQGSHPMGMRRVLAQPIVKAKKKPNKRVRSLCMTHCPMRRGSYIEAYVNFKVAFQEASATLRSAVSVGLERVDVRFPCGGVPFFYTRVRDHLNPKLTPS